MKMLLPPYLKQHGYGEVDAIQKLSRKLFIDEVWHPYWVEWRGIFEYLACVEYAYQCVINFPKGTELLSDNWNVKTKYHTASLTFFSKAVLDVLAGWLKDKHSINSQGAEISLSKGTFQKLLIKSNPLYSDIFAEYKEFLDSLNDYRINWIHRVVGGAVIGGDKRPGDPGFTDENIDVLIPINPTVNIYSAFFNEQLDFYTAQEFSESIYGGTKNIIFDIIELSLPLFDYDQSTSW